MCRALRAWCCRRLLDRHTGFSPPPLNKFSRCFHHSVEPSSLYQSRLGALIFPNPFWRGCRFRALGYSFKTPNMSLVPCRALPAACYSLHPSLSRRDKTMASWWNVWSTSFPADLDVDEKETRQKSRTFSYRRSAQHCRLLKTAVCAAI